MHKENFIYNTYCQLGIISDEITPENITRELDVIPKRSFIKGEKEVSKHSGSIIIKPHNLWAFESKKITLQIETISPHIAYFKSVFQSKIDYLKKYKENNLFEIFFGIYIETDNAGIGLDLNEDELTFINSISNRIHFSVVCNDNIVEVR